MLCVATTPSSAATIPYPDKGIEAPANSFFAASTGDLKGYFYGASAAFTETVGLEVNGILRASNLFNNKSTTAGAAYDFGLVKAGDLLTFILHVSTGDTFYSDQSRNKDGLNHVYTTAYAGGVSAIPAGTYIGFEDLRGGGDKDYNDDTFVFTNTTTSLSAVPLPASAPMFGAALLGLAGLGYVAKRKKASATA